MRVFATQGSEAPLLEAFERMQNGSGLAGEELSHTLQQIPHRALSDVHLFSIHPNVVVLVEDFKRNVAAFTNDFGSHVLVQVVSDRTPSNCVWSN